MKNLTEVLQYWLQGQINDAVAGHSSRIAYLEGFVSSLSERLEKLEKSSKASPGLAYIVDYLNSHGSGFHERIYNLEKAYSDMATTKDLLKDTRPEALMDKLQPLIAQLIRDELEEGMSALDEQTNVDDKRDAQRYRWLRNQHWSDNVVAVVQQPKDTIKVGAQCYSAARLDALIDKELKK